MRWGGGQSSGDKKKPCDKRGASAVQRGRHLACSMGLFDKTSLKMLAERHGVKGNSAEL